MSKPRFLRGIFGERGPCAVVSALCVVGLLAGCSDVTAVGARFPVDDSLAVAMANSHVGSREWLSSNLASPSNLAVWASPYTASPGDTLDIYIHAQSESVYVKLYRLGWYVGTGGVLVSQQRIFAHHQPACSAPFPGPVVCPWQVSTVIALPVSLLSGVYLVQVVDTSGAAALYPFVLRARASSNFVVVVPQLTWQAYNDFGGSSFYTTGPDGHLGHLVSFDRPYALRGGATYLYGTGYSNDISVLLWLERQGYDVTYISDVDLPALGLTLPPPRKGLLFIGHDEYWTLDEFDAVQRFRDSGIHLAFFAGNAAYWRVRLSASPVTGLPTDVVACYKSDPDPDAQSALDRTTLFRNLNRPENGLVGTGYYQHAYGGPYPLVVADSDMGMEGRSFLVGAGMVLGDSIPSILNMNIGNWPKFASLEGNQVLDNGATPAGLQVLFRVFYTGGVRTPQGVFETTFYRAHSGSGVFSSGFNEWGRFLSGFFEPENGTIAAVTGGVMQWMRVN